MGSVGPVGVEVDTIVDTTLVYWDGSRGIEGAEGTVDWAVDYVSD